MFNYDDYLKTLGKNTGLSPYLNLENFGSTQAPQALGSSMASNNYGGANDGLSAMLSGNKAYGTLGGQEASPWGMLKNFGTSLQDLMPKGFLDSTENGIKTQGYGMPLIAGAKGLFDAFNSYGTNKLAKQSFALQKDIALANLEGSKKSYNTNLANKAQDASSGYQNVDDYVNKNRVA